MKRALLRLILIAIILTFTHPVTAQDTGPYHEAGLIGRGMVRSVAWSSDGQMIAVGGARGIWLYTPELEDIGLLTGHTKAVYGMAFSPDNTQLVSVSHDHTVRVWDLATQTQRLLLEGHTGLLISVAWSLDGTTIASSGYDPTVRIWDAAAGTPVEVIEREGQAAHLVLYQDDGTLAIADLIPGHEATEFRAYNPDQTQMAVVDWDGDVQIRDAATNEVLFERPEHMDWITGLFWDKASLRSVTDDGRSESWDPNTGELLSWDQSGESVPVNMTSPDGSKVAAVGADGQVAITDGATHEVIAVLPGLANMATWSPDGTQIAVALRNGTIKLWSTDD
jgi:WD40 repeat protein